MFNPWPAAVNFAGKFYLKLVEPFSVCCLAKKSQNCHKHWLQAEYYASFVANANLQLLKFGNTYKQSKVKLSVTLQYQCPVNFHLLLSLFPASFTFPPLIRVIYQASNGGISFHEGPKDKKLFWRKYGWVSLRFSMEFLHPRYMILLHFSCSFISSALKMNLIWLFGHDILNNNAKSHEKDH